MVHPARIRYADDWTVVRSEIVNVSAIVGGGLEHYAFRSAALGYSAEFYLPKGNIGASIGVNLSTLGSIGLDALNSFMGNAGVGRGGNNNWHLIRGFALNDLVGGMVSIGSVGATLGPIDGNGATLKIYDNGGHDVMEYEGGSFGAGAGAGVNIGTASGGLLIGPYNER